MRGRYDDAGRAKYHWVAAFHHKVKAATYSQIGFGQKAASHRRRAKWHAAFGTPPEEEAAKAFHAQFIPSIRRKFDRASAEIKTITDLTKEIAKYSKEVAGVGTGHSAKTVKKDIHRVPYDAARVETKVKAAGRSVGAFAKSFRNYLNALKARDKTKGGNFYTEYDDVGTMIDSLIRLWLNAIEEHTKISKGDLAGDTEMAELIGLLRRTSLRDDTDKPSGARVPPEVSQIKAMIHDTFAVGAATLLGVRRAHNSNLGCVRIQDQVPVGEFKLYDSDEDD
jgi:hypothetical protein